MVTPSLLFTLLLTAGLALLGWYRGARRLRAA
jgi:hypothetical protein